MIRGRFCAPESGRRGLFPGPDDSAESAEKSGKREKKKRRKAHDRYRGCAGTPTDPHRHDRCDLDGIIFCVKK